jgi:hypothetical protein
MGLKINGSTSGSIEIDVPAVAGTDTSITIPAKNGGTFIVEESTGNIDLGPLDINGSASDDSVNIDASGRLLHGHTSAVTNLKFGGSGDFGSRNYIYGANQGFSNGLAILNYDATASIPALLKLGSSRNDTPGNNGLVGNGDTCCSIEMMGNDGARFIDLVRLDAVADTTAGTDDMPGSFRINVTRNGQSVVTERFRISENGRTSVFTTDTDAFEVGDTTGTGTTRKTIRAYHSATGVQNGTEMFYVRNNGDVRNATGSYSSISDAKLKENIVDAPSQWEDIKALQVRKFNFTEESNQVRYTQIGLIAQEAEAVCPGLVDDDPDLDENGEDLGTVTKGVKYSVLYMKSVKALQEAMTRIETLETANASLEARLTALEGGAS